MNDRPTHGIHLFCIQLLFQKKEKKFSQNQLFSLMPKKIIHTTIPVVFRIYGMAFVRVKYIGNK